jgi:hypothetical protein
MPLLQIYIASLDILQGGLTSVLYAKFKCDPENVTVFFWA